MLRKRASPYSYTDNAKCVTLTTTFPVEKNVLQ